MGNNLFVKVVGVLFVLSKVELVIPLQDLDAYCIVQVSCDAIKVLT